MKKYIIVAFMLLGVLGCTSLEIPGQAGNDEKIAGKDEKIAGKDGDGTITVTTTVSMGVSTRALTPDGVKTFSPGDQVAFVYTRESAWGDYAVKAVSDSLTASNIFDNGKKARLTVTLTNPKAGGDLRLVYPASMAASYYGDVAYDALSSQDGTLASLAGSLDLAIGTGTLAADGSLPAAITMVNQLAVVAFTIEDETGKDITSTVTSLIINDGTNGYTVNRTAAEGPIYLAMQPVGATQTILLSANAGSASYLKTVTGKTLDAGKLYPVELSMSPDVTGRCVPLTFEARTDGACVGFKKAYDLSVSVQYSLNGGHWTDYNDESIVLEHAGDKVSFRGNNAAYAKHSAYSTSHSFFYCDEDCYLYGNVMSLVNATGFAVESQLTQPYAFYQLFANKTHILSHDTKELLLPATSLSSQCYDSMFEGCTGLTRAPALPAEHVAQYCYQEMFKGCTGLTDVPDLSARYLESYCCKSMFEGCTSLQTAPALPAESLARECYQSMFCGCSSLTTPPALPATTLASSCYLQMFMDCTSLQTAPDLPAPKLVSYCYKNMFWGCTSLTRIVCLATDLTETTGTQSWLYKASPTGTFVKPENVVWPLGTDGIPTGWTVTTYNPAQL